MFLPLIFAFPPQEAFRAMASLTVTRPTFEFGGWAGWDTASPTGAISEDGRWSAYSWMGGVELRDHAGQGPGWSRNVSVRGNSGRPLDVSREGKWRAQSVPLALTPDGRLYARGTAFGFAIENVKTGEAVRARRDAEVENPARGLAFSPDGKTLAIVSGSRGKFRLSLLDMVTGRERPTATPVAAKPWTPRFTRDSRYIVTASPVPMLIDLAGKVRLRLREASTAYYLRTGGTLKNEGLIGLWGRRWQASWIGPNPPFRESAQYGDLQQVNAARGFADASGEWFAAPLKSLLPVGDGYKTAVRIFRPKGPLDVAMSSEAEGFAISPGGRWLLVLDSTRFLVVDTTQ